MIVKKVVEPHPALPAEWDVADAAALQALAEGKATKDQQQRALNWIVYSAAGTYELEYRTDSRDHAFASGKRHVGLQVVKMLKIDTSKFKQK